MMLQSPNNLLRISCKQGYSPVQLQTSGSQHQYTFHLRFHSNFTSCPKCSLQQKDQVWNHMLYLVFSLGVPQTFLDPHNIGAFEDFRSVIQQNVPQLRLVCCFLMIRFKCPHFQLSVGCHCSLLFTSIRWLMTSICPISSYLLD